MFSDPSWIFVGLIHSNSYNKTIGFNGKNRKNQINFLKFNKKPNSTKYPLSFISYSILNKQGLKKIYPNFY